MGYTTDFTGSFKLDRVMDEAHAAYLNKLADTRRMVRDPAIAANLDDPLREAVDLPLGPEGAYFTGGCGEFGQGGDDSIVAYNSPPETQPGLWLQWVVNADRTEVQWDGGEKFYNYVEWLEYVIEHFLTRWGYVLNGEVRWQGEDPDDVGVLVVEDNTVSEQSAF
jgi:hypothetical protein